MKPSKGTVLTIVFLAFIGAWSISLIWQGSEYECEVCVNYKGFEMCQTVEGMDKENTIMTGLSTACGGVTNGRTESIECGNTPPTKVVCRKL